MRWISYVWIDYFWSSLKGNGPEALVQTVIYAALAFMFIPPLRHWFERHIKALHEKFDESHRMMRHIIKHHPDIPPLPPSEPKIKP